MVTLVCYSEFYRTLCSTTEQTDHHKVVVISVCDAHTYTQEAKVPSMQVKKNRLLIRLYRYCNSEIWRGIPVKSRYRKE